MKVRRITASNMQKALRKVSEEMGADAVILSNRKVAGGVEIVAADHYPTEPSTQVPAQDLPPMSRSEGLSLSERPSRSAVPIETAHRPSASKLSASKPAKSVQTTSRQPQKRLGSVATTATKVKDRNANPRLRSTSLGSNESTYSAASERASSAQWDRQQQLQNALVEWKQSNPTFADEIDEPGWEREAATSDQVSQPRSQGLGNSFATMKAELDQLQAMLVADAQSSNHWSSDRSQPAVFTSPYAAMSLASTNGAISGQAVTTQSFSHQASMPVRPSWHQWSQYSPCNLVQAELWNRWQQVGLEDWLCFEICSDIQGFEAIEEAWLKTIKRLQRRIPIAQTRFINEGGVLALLGPTGAGKTTTTCKLAVEKVLSQGPNSVALVTTDNYRIAAHGQLLTLGRILGIRVKTLQASESLAECLQTLTEFESILIDTAGLTSNDPDLSLQMDLLQQSRSHFDALLALPSTSQGRSLRRLMQLYAPLLPSACILTKLDEADAIGEVLSVVIEKQLPIAFVSCGQRVPDDLIQAKAYAILKEALHRAGLSVPTEQSTTGPVTPSAVDSTRTRADAGVSSNTQRQVNAKGDDAKAVDSEAVESKGIESKERDQARLLEEEPLRQELNNLMFKEGQPVQQGFQFEDHSSAS
jgi:flagellar biosynthesis protein FlhF